MKYIIILFLMIFSYSVNAQKVKKDGKTYQVKNEKIFLDGKEVTEALSLEDRETILKRAAMVSVEMKGKGNNNGKGKEKAEKTDEKIEKQTEKLEKEKKKAEKAQKKAEKAQKRAKKELKKKQKAQDRFDRANNRLESAQKTYDRLKRKGKLSPQDEVKWLEKLEKLREDITRAKKKL